MAEHADAKLYDLVYQPRLLDQVFDKACLALEGQLEENKLPHAVKTLVELCRKRNVFDIHFLFQSRLTTDEVNPSIIAPFVHVFEKYRKRIEAALGGEKPLAKNPWGIYIFDDFTENRVQVPFGYMNLQHFQEKLGMHRPTIIQYLGLDTSNPHKYIAYSEGPDTEGKFTEGTLQFEITAGSFDEFQIAVYQNYLESFYHKSRSTSWSPPRS
jgi:hypothetical protein